MHVAFAQNKNKNQGTNPKKVKKKMNARYNIIMTRTCPTQYAHANPYDR